MTSLLSPTRHGLWLPPPEMSLAQVFGELLPEMRQGILESFNANELEDLTNEWRFMARREQLPPQGDWNVWANIAGRGAGKTRTGAEYLIHLHRNGLVGEGRSAVIAPTINDIWAVIVEGNSGILASAPKDFQPHVHTMRKKLTWPDGSQTNLFSAEEPDRLRGPAHGFVWLDELASMGVRQDEEESDRQLGYLWSMMWFGLRLGKSPEALVTTTPRPRRLIRDFVKDAAKGLEGGPVLEVKGKKRRKVVITGGSTYANALNLPDIFLEEIRRAYEGTRLGQQEIYAKILEEISGGLWTQEMIDLCHLDAEAPKDFKKVVVAVDPPITSTAESDEAGIIAAGVDYEGKVFILGDFSMKGSPTAWVGKTLEVFDEFGADLIVAEKNQGGDMVEHSIKTQRAFAPVKMVWASRGKAIRAQPVALRYEQGKVKHVGHFLKLEEEMMRMTAGRMKKSPNRADSLVYAVSELAPAMQRRVGFFGRQLRI